MVCARRLPVGEPEDGCIDDLAVKWASVQIVWRRGEFGIKGSSWWEQMPIAD